MLPVRVFFRKTGAAVYISHLDLQRAVFRAINRSGIKAVYTEGFNPHIKISFAAPLSIFQKSECEFFDFFAEENSYREILEKLKTAFPSGLEVLDAAAPVRKMNEIALADYLVRFDTKFTADDIKQKLSSQINIMKKSKKGATMTDISPLIKSMSFADVDGGVVLRLRCACGSGEHLNVKYISDYLSDSITGCDIVRLAMLTADGSVFA